MTHKHGYICVKNQGGIMEWQKGLKVCAGTYISKDGKLSGRIFSADFETNVIEMVVDSNPNLLWKGTSQEFFNDWDLATRA